MGAQTDLFPIPVCSSFREKSFNGQLCYEADINKYKGRVDWQNSLQKGLSFVVDINEEYNIRKIIFDETTKQNSDGDLLNAFAKSEVLKTFSVHLQTISMKFRLVKDPNMLTDLHFTFACQTLCQWCCTARATTP